MFLSDKPYFPHIKLFSRFKLGYIYTQQSQKFKSYQIKVIDFFDSIPWIRHFKTPQSGTSSLEVQLRNDFFASREQQEIQTKFLQHYNKIKLRNLI